MAFFLKSKKAIFTPPYCIAGLGNRSFAHHSFLLFSKEQLSDRLLICSFKKSECAIALCKRVIALSKTAIAHSLFQKEQKLAKNERFSKLLIFCSKKRTIAHFQNERMPNPGV